MSKDPYDKLREQSLEDKTLSGLVALYDDNRITFTKLIKEIERRFQVIQCRPHPDYIEQFLATLTVEELERWQSFIKGIKIMKEGF